MAAKKWNDLMEERYGKEGWALRQKEMDAEIEREDLELNLKAVRELVGKTQVQVARAARATQGEISTTENRRDHLVSTLRKYVKALGGELEVVARFGDKAVKLHGV